MARRLAANLEEHGEVVKENEAPKETKRIRGRVAKVRKMVAGETWFVFSLVI